MEITTLFRDAVRITQKHRLLWVLQAIPVGWLLIAGSIMAQTTIGPLMSEYYLLVDSQEIDPQLIANLPSRFWSTLYTLVPLVVVTAVLTILVRSSMYAAIGQFARGYRFRARDAISAALRYAPLVVGLMVIFSVSLALPYILLHAFVITGTARMIIMAIVVVLVFCIAIFSWPGVVIAHFPIKRALAHSFMSTIRNGWLVALVLLVLLAIHTVIACVLGAALGIALYVHSTPGMLLAVGVIAVSIPVRIWMHALYSLLFISLTVESPRAHHPRS